MQNNQDERVGGFEVTNHKLSTSDKVGEKDYGHKGGFAYNGT